MKFEFGQIAKHLTQDGAAVLFPHLTGLTTLSLDACAFSNQLLALILQYMPNLTAFSGRIEENSITITMLETFLRNYPKLQEVSLQIYPLTKGSIEPTRVIEALSRCPSLKTVELGMFADDQAIERLVSIHPRLEVLKLTHCTKLTDKALDSLAKFESLHTLSIIGTEFSADGLADLPSKLSSLMRLT
jgi:hypothetical protein